MNNEQVSFIVNTVMNHDPYSPRPLRLLRTVNTGVADMVCEEMEQTGQVIRLVLQHGNDCIYFCKFNNQFYQVITDTMVSRIVDVSFVPRI